MTNRRTPAKWSQVRDEQKKSLQRKGFKSGHRIQNVDRVTTEGVETL